MNITLEKKKEEAIARLNILKNKGLMHCVLRSFAKKDSELYYSEFNGICGALYYLNDLGGAKPEWIELVKEFEEQNNALVYHVTHQFTNIGELLNVFYVSDYDEEWEYDREDLKNNYSLAYVYNLSDMDCSEFGTIGYSVIGGGVVRTA